MHIVLNSPILYVVSYPALNAIEVIDKRRGVGVLMRDETAERFRRELADAVREDGEGEDGPAVEEVMGHYDALMTQPAIYH